VLRQPVLGTMFARAYDVNSLPAGEWPQDPLDLAQVFDTVLLPPLRNADRLSELREAWMRRIRYEAIMHEGWSAQDDGTSTSNGTKIGTKAALRPPSYEKFLIDEVPVLTWKMEEDLFKAGDQRAAALRMLEHLEKHITNRHAVDWAKSFVLLINGPKPTAATPGDPSSANGSTSGQKTAP